MINLFNKLTEFNQFNNPSLITGGLDETVDECGTNSKIEVKSEKEEMMGSRTGRQSNRVHQRA